LPAAVRDAPAPDVALDALIRHVAARLEPHDATDVGGSAAA
jgi:hypothetical protein